jgi:hypothetical protein
MGWRIGGGGGAAAKTATALVCLAVLAIYCRADTALAITIEEHSVPTYTNDQLKLSTVGSTLYLAGSAKGLSKISANGAVTVISNTSGPTTPITPVTAGPDGNPWWVGALSVKVAGSEHSFFAIYELTPSGVTMKIQTPIEIWRGTPQSITLGPDGNLWYPLPTSEPSIDRYVPGGGITEYPLEGGSTYPDSITVGANRSLWFTQFWPAAIGPITLNGELTEWPTGTSPYGDPQSLVTAPEGAEWFVESDPQRIGRITPTGQISEFPLPTAAAFSAIPLAVGPEGAIWFGVANKVATGQASQDSVGRITPQGEITEYPLPMTGPSASPISMALGPEGDLWVAIINPTMLARINPSGQPPATRRSHIGRHPPHTKHCRVRRTAHSHLGDCGGRR